MIAHNPLHGSGQAALPHPALALGEDVHAAQGVGMGSPGSRARCLRTCTGSLIARDSGTSRFRWTRWSFPLLLTASAPRRKLLTRLNTRPGRSPVNASTLPSRAAPHDSGPRWVPDPLSYDFCI